MTVVCLVIALWGIEWNEVAQSFRGANYTGLPLLTALLAAFYWLKAVRWRLLLHPMREFRTRELVPAMMIGFMGNNVLPAHLGEFVRVWVLGRQTDLSMAAIFSTLVLERVFDVIIILLLLGLGLVIVPGMPQEMHTASLVIAGITAVGVAVLIVFILFTSQFVAVVEWVLFRLKFLPIGLRNAAVKTLESGADGLSSLKSGRLLIGIFLTSLIQWLIQAAMIYVALRSFGLMATFPTALIVMGVVAFGVTVPSAPGFFGVIQLCFWKTLEPFGMSQAAVFSASVYYHLAQYIPVTLIGLYFLSRLGLRLGDIERGAETVEEPLESGT